MEPEIRFRLYGGQIISHITGDLDISRAEALLDIFRQSLRRVSVCWTCFQRPRAIVNYPCGCFCNCLECSLQMSICSECGGRIVGTIEIVIF